MPLFVPANGRVARTPKRHAPAANGTPLDWALWWQGRTPGLASNASIAADELGADSGPWSHALSNPAVNHIRYAELGAPEWSGVLYTAEGANLPQNLTHALRFDMQAAEDAAIGIASISEAVAPVITTAEPHGRATGDRVWIRNVTGITFQLWNNGTDQYETRSEGIDGFWTIEVLSPTTFTVTLADAEQPPRVTIAGTGGIVLDAIEGFIKAFSTAEIESVSLTAIMRFQAQVGWGGDTRIDHFNIGHGTYGVMQQQAIHNAVPPSAGALTAHGQISGGGSTFGALIPIRDDRTYRITLKLNAAAGFVRLIVLDNADGSLVGVSQAQSSFGTMVNFSIQDYLARRGGQTDVLFVGMDWTSAAWPLQSTWSAPAVTSLARTQSDLSTATVTWRGMAYGYRILVSENGGSFTEQEDFQTLTTFVSDEQIVIGGLNDGSSYVFRVEAIYHEVGAVAADTPPLTIDNSSFLPSHYNAFTGSGAFGPGNWDTRFENPVGALPFTYRNVNRLLASAGNAAMRYADVAYPGHQYVRMRIDPDNPGNRVAPVARMQSNGNGYAAVLGHNNILNFYTARVFKITNGGTSFTQIGGELHTSNLWAVNDYLAIRAEGDGTVGNEVTLSVYRKAASDGPQDAAFGTLLGTRQDTSSPFVSGQPGLNLGDGGKGDDFYAVALP